MRTIRIVGACLVAVSCFPAISRADGYVAPFLGANFGGSVGTPLNVAARDRSRAAFGVSFGVMGGGVFGVELDLAFTRNFYTETGGVVTGNNLLTLVPAVIIGIPIGGQRGAGIRPYVTAGVGMVRRDVDFGALASLSKSDLAYSLGGGVMGFITDRFGIRGDVRYFRNFKVDDIGLTGASFSRGTFNVGRASVGAVFRF